MFVKVHKLGKLGVLAVAFLLLGRPARCDPPPFWQPTLDSAQRLAAHTRRLVLVYFHADWCRACLVMDQELFGHPEIAGRIQAGFVPVRINVDHFPSTARQYGVTVLPTTVVISPQGTLLGAIPGNAEPAAYLAQLEQLAADAARRSLTAHQQSSLAANPPGAGAQGAGWRTAGPQASWPPATGLESQWSRAATAQPSGPGSAGRGSFGPQSSEAQSTGPQSPGPRSSGFQSAPPLWGPAAGAGYPGNPTPSADGWSSGTPKTDAVPGATGGVRAQGAAAATVSEAQVIPTGHPPLGLDGCCPVTLVENQKWVPGDRRWGAIHRGRTYLFAGAEEQRRFLADPDRYAPVLSGLDVVAARAGRHVGGLREHGVFFDGHVYLFADEASLEEFSRRPEHYADAAWQAMGKDRPQGPSSVREGAKGWFRWGFKWPPVPPPPPGRAR